MSKGSFHIISIDVKKSIPNFPVDIKLPKEIGMVKGVFFTVPGKFTNYDETVALGTVSFSLDNGISNIISGVQVYQSLQQSLKDIIPLNEDIPLNTSVRIFYKDHNVAEVSDSYLLKVYVLYENRKRCKQ